MGWCQCLKAVGARKKISLKNSDFLGKINELDVSGGQDET